jgi:hypothetical protein
MESKFFFVYSFLMMYEELVYRNMTLCRGVGWFYIKISQPKISLVSPHKNLKLHPAPSSKKKNHRDWGKTLDTVE